MILFQEFSLHPNFLLGTNNINQFTFSVSSMKSLINTGVWPCVSWTVFLIVNRNLRLWINRECGENILIHASYHWKITYKIIPRSSLWLEYSYFINGEEHISRYSDLKFNCFTLDLLATLKQFIKFWQKNQFLILFMFWCALLGFRTRANSINLYWFSN